MTKNASLYTYRNIKTTDETIKGKIVVITLSFYILSIIFLSKTPSLSIYSKIIGFILAIVFAIQLFFIEKRRIIIPEELIIFLCFIILQGFSVYWASYPVVVVKMTFTLFQLLILSIIVTNIYIKYNSISIIIFPLIAGLLFVSFNIHNEIGYLPGLGQKNLRISGNLNNPNAYALSLIVCILFTISFLRQSKSKIIKTISITLLILFSYDLLLTGSRKGIASLLLVISCNFLLLPTLSKLPIRDKLRIITISLLILPALLLATYNSPYYKRFQDTFQYMSGQPGQAETMTGRSLLIKTAYKNWIESPIFGKGTAQFMYTKSLPPHLRHYAHNNYAEILSNNGITGLLAYYSIYLLLIIKFIGLKIQADDLQDERNIDLCITTMIVLFFWDLGMVSYYDKFIWILLSTLIATNYISKNKINIKSK